MKQVNLTITFDENDVPASAPAKPKRTAKPAVPKPAEEMEVAQ